MRKVLGLAMIAAISCGCAGHVRYVTAAEFAARASNLVIPQSRSFAVPDGRSPRPDAAGPKITEVAAGVVILDQVATTTMDVSLANTSGRNQEAEMLVPVPDGAALKSFTFEGAASEPTAELLPKEKAKELYHSIVSKLRDPALVEFAGYNLIRTSVFPVPANGKQKVRLTYEHLLRAEGNRVDYVLPRSESLAINVPWSISVRIKSKNGIVTAYSPSHNMAVTSQTADEVFVKLTPDAATEPGPFILSYLTPADRVTASLMAYPDARVGGGYFLLLAAVPPATVPTADAKDSGGSAVKREVTVVIDRSGSMAGEKLEQARAAALQIVDGLLDGEAFNIIDYSTSISKFAPAAVVKDRRNTQEARGYLHGLTSGGGTNLHDALTEALRQKPIDGMLPIVLFLTDGLPTVGVQDEVAIRNAAMKANAYNRRLFTFGVGYDVNAPLLSYLATNSRAVSTFVLPQENVEAKVSQVYRRLSGPVLSEPKIEAVDNAGALTTRRVSDLQPDKLPDMFDGDKLVLLGRYSEEAPIAFRLTGSYLGKPRTFSFTFNLDTATTRNSFVPRLWASRKVAFLVDEIRQAGASAATAVSDPKMKELVDEIVRLSTEFGILTEYTAFLAKEGTNLAQRDEILKLASGNLKNRAMMSRSGAGGVNQSLNNSFQQSQTIDNRRNRFLDQNMNSVQIANVQQLSDRAFFQRGNRWVDSRTIEKEAETKIDQIITFGSPEYMNLMDRLVNENRQSTLSLSGEILLKLDGKNILVKGPDGGS